MGYYQEKARSGFTCASDHKRIIDDLMLCEADISLVTADALAILIMACRTLTVDFESCRVKARAVGMSVNVLIFDRTADTK